MIQCGARRLAVAAVLACLLCGATSAAHAAVSCSASATGPAFGVYSPTASLATTATGTVTVTCSLLNGGATTVNLTVSLNSGSSGSFGSRTMQSGTSQLKYNIYRSPAYLQIWGDGTGGSYYSTSSIALSHTTRTASSSGTMYGQVPAGQDVAPGTYLDTITVTVNY